MVGKGRTGRGRRRGFLLVISGPSGVGKNTLVNMILTRVDGLRYSISATTRPSTVGEVDGVNYHFVTDREFDEMVTSGELLEWACVYGHRYGTPRRYIEDCINEGLDVVLDIDIQGARQLMARFRDGVFVFLMPPSMEELARRLKTRARDSDHEVASRLRAARNELEAVYDYDYVILNDDLARASKELEAIITAERCRVERCRCEGFIESLGRAETE